MRKSVGVLIPVRSPAPWLEQALNSVINQSVTPDEIVLVFHGFPSPADSQLVATIRDLVIVQAPVEATFADVLNTGLHCMTTDVIARIDADDIWLPTHLEILLEPFDADPLLVLCGGAADYVDSAGADMASGVNVPRWLPTLQLLVRNPFVHSSVLFQRSSALAVGGYQTCRSAEDLLLWLKLALVGRIRLEPRARILYRLHPAQTSSKPMSPQEVELVRTARMRLARKLKVPASLANMAHERWATHHVTVRSC